MPPKPSKTWPEKRIVFYDPLKIDSKKIFSVIYEPIYIRGKQFSDAENPFLSLENSFLGLKNALATQENSFPRSKIDF